jgi:hypothetical protein
VVDDREPARRQAAHEDVLGDRQVGCQRRLLVDDRDAAPDHLVGTGRLDRLAGDPDLARVSSVGAGQDLDQR